MKHLKYLNYLLRHKWYVFLESIPEGIIWRGLLHDMSKFFPSQWFPYANYFYGKKGDDITKGRDETGYYKPTDTGDKAFDFAWLLHQKWNRHHWQWWILPEDEGGVKILPMTEPYLKEMICDWIGAGKAQGHFSPKNDKYFETRNWYRKNRNKMQLHPATREWIEDKIEFSNNPLSNEAGNSHDQLKRTKKSNHGSVSESEAGPI